MKAEWTIKNIYGAWVAEHTFGYTVWAKTKNELLSCLGAEEVDEEVK